MSTMGMIRPADLVLMMPELYLGAATIFLLLYCVYRLQRANSFLVVLGLFIFAFTSYLEVFMQDRTGVVMNGMFLNDKFTTLTKCLLLLSGSIVLLLAADWLKEKGGRPFEFVILILFSTLGLMFMISANDLIVLYMGLEMSSLALYVLAAFERDHAKSNEAGLKYFVLGSLASGMMLFGISLVYGFAGSTSFDALAAVFTGAAASKAIIVGLILIIIGFCFKLSAAPFHMWAPDVYEGAPTPVTAFFATGPKIAALALFTRILLEPFGPLIDQWQQIIAVVSLASMVVGALAAIMQTNIKRLLAYSSIGHAGFMLMGLAAGNEAGVQAMLIYMAVYIFMSAGSFGCVLLMRRNGEAVEEIRDLAGLAETRPWMALVLAAFMFSLAGIPPLAGFFGKFYVVIAAIDAGLIWLAIAAMVTSVVGCYYYLKVVKVMYFDESRGAFDARMPLSLQAGVALCAFITLFFFLLPSPLVLQAKVAAAALFGAP